MKIYKFLDLSGRPFTEFFRNIVEAMKFADKWGYAFIGEVNTPMFY